VYDRYLKTPRMTKLKPDPRVSSRAWSYASVFIIAGIVLGCEAASIGASIAFGPRIDASAIDRALPYSIFWWLYHYYLDAHYASAAVTTLVQTDLTIGGVAGVGVFGGFFIAAMRTHSHWMKRRDGLSNERGSARWATIEEVAAAGLLPPNYHLRRGFPKAHRANRLARKRRADDLLRERADLAAIAQFDEREAAGK
jgi:type IV secretory pathway TraG/TraD family ATPase VirD4